MSTAAEPDRTVVEEVQRLFLRHAGLLRGFILGLLPDHNRAEDVFQEVFLTISRKAAEFRAGRLPLWDPFSFAGAPFAHFGKYCPLYLIYYLFPSPVSLAWIQLLKSVIAFQQIHHSSTVTVRLRPPLRLNP